MLLDRNLFAAPLQKVDSEQLEQTEAVGTTPLDAMIREEQCAALRQGLERLKAIDRATLVAFYIRGQSLQQMSADFETPVGTIKRRLHVARNRLRQQLEGAPRGGGARKRERRELALAR